MRRFYRDILRESWRMGRVNLFLWPLAFFAFFVGISGTFQIVFDILAPDRQLTLVSVFDSDFLTSIFLSWSLSFNEIPWDRLLTFSIADFTILAFFMLLLFVLMLLAVVTVSSEGGLVSGVNDLYDRAKTSYLKCLRRGLDNFPYLLIIHVLFLLIYMIILALLILPLLDVVTSGSLLAFLYGALIYFIVVPVVIILNLIRRYAVLFIMTKRYGRGDFMSRIATAFYDSWLLFRTNWILSIETALIVLAAFILFVLASVILLYLTMLFFTLFGTILSFSALATQFAINVMVIVLFGIGIVLWTYFTVFQTSIWVGVFRRITAGERFLSKVHRLTVHFPLLHRKIF